MQLTCYQIDREAPLLVPARQQRAWMDAFPHRHPYRCLPMTIANAYGWELLCPADFEAEWNGGRATTDISIRSPGNDEQVRRLVRSHFGGGVLTFHTGYLFHTEPDWELVATGPTNEPKDGIGCLTGVVETHWLPFPFTMNWMFTRPGKVQWRKDEPFCLIYPVLRNAVDQVEPIIRRLDSNEELKEQYVSWSSSRGDFLTKLRERDSDVVKAGWQRHYFRGERVADGAAAENHLKKLHPAKPIRMGQDFDSPSPSTSPNKLLGVSEENIHDSNTVDPIAERAAQADRARLSATAGRRFSFQVGDSVAAARSDVFDSPPVADQEMSYFICTTPRSGSNLLSQGLEATGVAGRPLEVFDAVYEKEWKRKLDIQSDEEYFPKILAHGRTPNGVFGAKLLRFQWDNLARHLGRKAGAGSDATLDDLYSVFGPTKFVWLRREDKTLQAISWFRAGKTKEWFHLVDVPVGGSEKELDFDSAIVSYYKRVLSDFDRAWQEHFERWKVDVLELVYEDFAHDYHATIERVIRFLSPARAHEAKTPTPRYLRQADELTFDMHCRYASEVPDEFVRTPLARRESNRFAREGAGHFQRREFGAAEVALRRAAEWDGLSVTILQNLGSALASQGKFEEALTYFQRALRLNPENAETWRNTALAMEQSGRWPEAEAYYRKTAELAPHSVPLSRCLERLERLRSEGRNAVPVDSAESRRSTIDGT